MSNVNQLNIKGVDYDIEAKDYSSSGGIATALSGKIDTAGTGLSKSGTTLNHSNSVTAQTSQNLRKFTYDAQGHITGSSTIGIDATATEASTNLIYSGAVVASGKLRCSTASSTSAKTINATGFVLKSGSYLIIQFDNSNNYAGALTLNINSTGAKTIYLNNSATSSSNYSFSAGTYLVYYDGSYYYFNSDGSFIGKNSFSLNRLASITTGTRSVAEGYNCAATGTNSHAEGNYTVASESNSHSEGSNTVALGSYSHAEGLGTFTIVSVSSITSNILTMSSSSHGITAGNFLRHTENGNYKYYSVSSVSGTTVYLSTSPTVSDTSNWYRQLGVAYGTASHTEGYYTTASGNYSHAEGYLTRTYGQYAHAEGSSTWASGESSHAEGYATRASKQYSHAEGNFTVAGGTGAHAEGYHDSGTISVSSITSNILTMSSSSHGIDINNILGHYEGSGTTNYYKVTAVSGTSVTLSSTPSVSNTSDWTRRLGIAYGNYSHSEGYNTKAIGNYSHAEGYSSTASGESSHAEGQTTTASGPQSHAEGYVTKATGAYSHAEGFYTTASGYYSHAEGNYTTASGYYSHAEGNYTSTNSKYCQHVFGEYNTYDTGSVTRHSTSGYGTYVEVVGNGTSTSSRSNARTLDWSGNETLAGNLTTSGTVFAVNFAATSDKRLKKNIIDYKCEKSILDLPIKEFDYVKNDTHTIGCLAQDLQEICPQIVNEDSEGYLSIQESKIVYLLLQELKEQKDEIKELKKEISLLKGDK